MPMTVYKNGKRLDHWSTTEGSLEFNEKAEAHKEPSMYRVEREEKGLSERSE